VRARKTFSNRLTNKYLLIIRNEENFAEKTTFSFTYAKLIAVMFVFFLILMVASLYMAQTLLAQWFDPRHSEQEVNRQLVQISNAYDSLVVAAERKDQFIQSIQRVMNGNVFEQGADTTAGANTSASLGATVINTGSHEVDSAFRREFEAINVELQNLGNSYSDELQELFFFTPIAGIISDGYNPANNHYGVDVVSKQNEPVKCVADGTVIFADYDFSDSGYVIAVQHRNNLISLYKHNSAILKKVGNFVGGGEIISIIGNTGELTSGPHLHFELWLNGNPVNPEDFISF